MGAEKFITPRKQGEHHFGRHSVAMGIDAINAKLKAWRTERVAAHETGHSIDEIPQDQEIILFDIRKPLDK